MIYIDIETFTSRDICSFSQRISELTNHYRLWWSAFHTDFLLQFSFCLRIHHHFNILQNALKFWCSWTEHFQASSCGLCALCAGAATRWRHLCTSPSCRISLFHILILWWINTTNHHCFFNLSHKQRYGGGRRWDPSHASVFVRSQSSCTCSIRQSCCYYGFIWAHFMSLMCLCGCF